MKFPIKGDLSSMTKIHVLIADDHPVFRFGLKRILENAPDIEVVGEAESASSVLKLVNQLKPDVVLLDIRFPGPSGIQVARELRRKYPDELKILILTAYDEDEFLFDAMRAGVHGYLLKNSSHEALIQAVRKVSTGERILSSGKINKILERFNSLALRNAREQSGLSDTELKLLEHLSLGHTYPEMSDRLYLSESTIKRLVKDVIVKLDASSRTQAVAKAIRRGLI